MTFFCSVGETLAQRPRFLSNVGPTLAQLRHSDRDNTNNHYTTLGQPQNSDHDNRKQMYNFKITNIIKER